MFFHTSKNDKVQSKKGQNYIPFLQSTYPEMQRKTSSGGQGGSGREPEQHVRPQPPVGGEASSHAPERRATPAPGGQGELRLRARPARATPAPSGQGGSGRASELPVDV